MNYDGIHLNLAIHELPLDHAAREDGLVGHNVAPCRGTSHDVVGLARLRLIAIPDVFQRLGIDRHDQGSVALELVARHAGQQYLLVLVRVGT